MEARNARLRARGRTEPTQIKGSREGHRHLPIDKAAIGADQVWDVEWQHVDELNDHIPLLGTPFDFHEIVCVHDRIQPEAQAKKGPQDFVAWCNDRNINARHRIENLKLTIPGMVHWRQKGVPSAAIGATNWRLLERIPAIHEPWRQLTFKEFSKEFGSDQQAVTKYLKDLLRRHEGEVVETWGEWRWHASTMPLKPNAWHPQFANCWADRAFLSGNWEDLDKKKLPRTTVLSAHWSVEGHYRRSGSAITLGELMLAIGSTHTLMDIYHWYYYANRIVHKRDHPKGSPDARAADALRKKELGDWGHGVAERAGWYIGNQP